MNCGEGSGRAIYCCDGRAGAGKVEKGLFGRRRAGPKHYCDGRVGAQNVEKRNMTNFLEGMQGRDRNRYRNY